MSSIQHGLPVRKDSGVEKTPGKSMEKAQAKAAEALQKNSALLAIRAKCLECSCDSDAEIRKCPVTYCALYPFRMGKRPSSKPRSMKKAA
jgi:hypothetical protein